MMKPVEVEVAMRRFTQLDIRVICPELLKYHKINAYESR